MNITYWNEKENIYLSCKNEMEDFYNACQTEKEKGLLWTLHIAWKNEKEDFYISCRIDKEKDFYGHYLLHVDMKVDLYFM